MTTLDRRRKDKQVLTVEYQLALLKSPDGGKLLKLTTVYTHFIEAYLALGFIILFLLLKEGYTVYIITMSH